MRGKFARKPDALVAHMAASLGYDTVQMQDGPYGLTEMVAVDRSPSRRAGGGCVPFELRSGLRATSPCACSAVELALNCDANTRMTMMTGGAAWSNAVHGRRMASDR